MLHACIRGVERRLELRVGGIEQQIGGVERVSKLHERMAKLEGTVEGFLVGQRVTARPAG